jgi:hypothetical protein
MPITNGNSKTQAELNRKLTEERIVGARIKRQQEEMHLAKMRGLLIEKSLVTKQAQFLLTALRQRFLLSVSTYARRFVGLQTVEQARAELRKMIREVLTEVKHLPKKVVDPNWLEELDNEESGL